MSYSTLPGQLGPILYSSVILQTILCLVLFLLFVSLFSPHTPVELDSFFCLLSCTPLDLLLHLASSMCAAASFELMYPDTAWWACSSVLFSFFLFWSNLQSSLTGIRCQHISPRWVKVQQCLIRGPPSSSHSLVQAGLIGFQVLQRRFPSAPLRSGSLCWLLI